MEVGSNAVAVEINGSRAVAVEHIRSTVAVEPILKIVVAQ